MSIKTIPSLVSDKTWRVEIKSDNTVEWKGLIDAWHGEQILRDENFNSGDPNAPEKEVNKESTLPYDINDTKDKVCVPNQLTLVFPDLVGWPECTDHWSAWPTYTLLEDKLHIGVFKPSKSYWLHLRPEYYHPKNGRHPLIPPLGLDCYLNCPEKSYTDRVAFFGRLDSKPMWYALVHSKIRRQDADTPLLDASPLLAMLNQATRHVRGTQFSGHPFCGLTPFFSQPNKADNGFDPITLVQLRETSPSPVPGKRSWDANVLKVFLGDDAPGETLHVHLDWSFFWRDGAYAAAPGLGFTVSGEIAKTNFAEQFEYGWTSEGNHLASVFERALNKRSDGRSDPLVEFALEDCSIVATATHLDNQWIRLGSVEIRPRAFADKKAAFTFKLFGHIACGIADAFPETELRDLECDVRYAAGSDPVPEFARMDESTEATERLLRETSPIVKLLGETFRTGTLHIKSKYQPGRNALTEIEIALDEKHDEVSDSAIVLNLRPFFVAKVDLPESSNSKTTLRWRSDDPQGAQWRVDDRTVEVTLPPQAVGEEMERGSRFWPTPDKSYIEVDKPIKYRFSRPTYLTLRPSPDRENRRFERSPLNLREIFRGADITRMTTEMVYPIEVHYERSSKATRQFRLTEVGEFYGKPAENLDVSKSALSEGSDLPQGLRGYLVETKGSFKTDVEKLHHAQGAAQLNFVSRLAELYVHDPMRPRSDVQLNEDITFRIRGRREGACTPSNPLPTGSDLTTDQKRKIADFLGQDDWDKNAIRAGIIHTFDFASELVEVLETPEAIDGIIESLVLSTLGATGRMQVAFAKGKTTFTIEVADGQLSSLIKARTGRIGALWNRAKHVVEYERTTAPSAQLADEQQCDYDIKEKKWNCESASLNNWPILRKKCEYVEPAQPVRVFADEPDASANSTGFVEAGVFVSQRIYVNSAWGRDLKHGYELPLWDPLAAEIDPAFYPKPQILIRCHGEEGKLSKLWIREPQRLYFYSSAEAGTTADTDAWRAIAGVDFDNLPRLPILEKKDASGAQQLEPGTSASKDFCTSPRFDLAVDAEGPINLQHGRGKTPMLVKLGRICISRSSQQSPQDLQTIEKEGTAYATFVETANTAAKVAEGTRKIGIELESLRSDLEDAIKRATENNVTDCNAIADGLKEQVKERINKLTTECRKKIEEGKRQLLVSQAEQWKADINALLGKLADAAHMPNQILDERAKAVRERLAEAKRTIEQAPSDDLTGVKRFLKQVADEIDAARKDIEGRVIRLQTEVSTQLLQRANNIQSDLKNAKDALPQNSNLEDLENAASHLKAAIQKVRSAPDSVQRILSPILGCLTFVLDQLPTVEKAISALGDKADQFASEMAKLVKNAITKLETLVGGVASELLQVIANASNTAMDGVAVISSKVSDQLDYVKAAENKQKVINAIKALEDHFTVTVDDSTRFLLGYRQQIKQFESAAAAEIERLNAVGNLESSRIAIINDVAGYLDKHLEEFSTRIKAALSAVIDAVKGECEKLHSAVNGVLDKAKQWAEEQKKAGLDAVLNSEAARQLEQIATKAEKPLDVGSKGLALARAVGELPKVTPLEFDIDIAAYVFDGKSPSIKITPAVARVRDAATGLLQSLGVATPTSELLDQFIPDKLQGIDFNKIFPNFAGIDFKSLFRNFKLPNLNQDHIKITHGFDRPTRRAWVNSTVDFTKAERQQLFEAGPVALGLEHMAFKAFSGAETSFVVTTPQTPTTRTNASLTADWILQGGGQALVRFKRVALKYDGVAGFDFSVSPNDIELHPSLKFISEFAAQFKKNLPPAIQIDEEGGRPVGVSAGTTVIIDDLPNLGIVSIGPIDMRSRLGLRVSGSSFVIKSSFSLGNKQNPIFLQIGWLGGGCWLECSAECKDGKVTPVISVGMCVGSARSLNLGGVAQASYSVQLYCYIEIKESNQLIAIGLSMVGAARIIGFVNAQVALLLEARHENGNTEGIGRLDVEVKISWCFTFRFSSSVRQKI